MMISLGQCPVCYALVIPEKANLHDEWHAKLTTTLEGIGQSQLDEAIKLDDHMHDGPEPFWGQDDTTPSRVHVKTYPPGYEPPTIGKRKRRWF
jgi:hypothetical protein